MFASTCLAQVSWLLIIFVAVLCFIPIQARFGSRRRELVRYLRFLQPHAEQADVTERQLLRAWRTGWPRTPRWQQRIFETLPILWALLCVQLSFCDFASVGVPKHWSSLPIIAVGAAPWYLSYRRDRRRLQAALLQRREATR